MCKRTLLLFFVTALLVARPARADTIRVQMDLRMPQGTLLYSAIADMSPTAVEFTPFGQLRFDFTGQGNVAFQPLISAKFIAYDAIFKILTPDLWFASVSSLAPVTTKYSVRYDEVRDSIVFHHFAGNDTPDSALQFQFQTAHAPEPSSLVLLGTGLMVAAGVLRRRQR